MSQNLDPKSDGRGVLQFKTGLMSVIKQKLAKRDWVQIDRNRDIEHLWDFYQRYKRRHKVDDIQRQEQRWRESGTFSADFGEYGHHVFRVWLMSLELTAYNIVPLEAPSLTNAIGVFTEVRGAISAIRYTEQFPILRAAFVISGQRDLLECVFGF